MGIIKKYKKQLDYAMVPFIWASGTFLKRVRKAGLHTLPKSREAVRKVGIDPIVDHYYEPLFQPSKLLHSMNDERLLPGIDLNEEEQLELLTSFDYAEELNNLDFSNDKGIPEFDYTNTNYTYGDAQSMYSMVRKYKPKRIVEIGSGWSTLMIDKAIEMNYRESEGKEIQEVHICIEPYEMPWLEKCPVKVIRERVETVDKKVFDQLESGDMLIIDSSHMIRPQGDVVVEYLQILPLLKKGVLVHIHDIFTPRDYPEHWLTEWNLFWNEQYLLEAFLTCNKEFRIILAMNYLMHHHRELLNEKFPAMKKAPKKYQNAAFWIRKEK